MANEVKNCFLINAPAASGKTTQIKSMVGRFLLDNPKDNILCITYTKRAANELVNDLKSEHIFVGTIHSFLHHFMQRYFAHSDILNLYFELYGEAIKQRITNATGDAHITESNEKYREKYGKLDYETVKKNITEIFYNESAFNSLYYGGLSHDDLIKFSKCIFDRFPVIRKRISLRYQYIFIDEYQDTMADVLNIFYDAVAGTESRLYLFGDRMQQIYTNYDGSFEERFALFDIVKMATNYRSVTEIVDILNRLYNDPEFSQDNSDAMKLVNPDHLPRVIVTNNVPRLLTKLQKENPHILILYLFNKERFSTIGASNLFRAFSGMKKYSFGRSYSAVDVLIAAYEENPDPLLKLLYCVAKMEKNFRNGQYGPIIQVLKSNKSMFCQDTCSIKTHSDKIQLFQKLTMVFCTIRDETKTISDLLSSLTETSVADKIYVDNVLADSENEAALTVPSIELIRVLNYLDNPKVSTQHGVKGESHDSVVFVADDSNNSPFVYMYRFFDLLSQEPISLHSFNQFYYAYARELASLQSTINMKISELKSPDYSKYESEILQKANTIMERFSDNPYFQRICQDKYTKYLNKPGVTKARDCLKESAVLGIISAYKLFYVGCSRARKNLTILLDSGKLCGDVSKQKKMFTELGFSVEEIVI